MINRNLIRGTAMGNSCGTPQRVIIADAERLLVEPEFIRAGSDDTCRRRLWSCRLQPRRPGSAAAAKQREPAVRSSVCKAASTRYRLHGVRNVSQPIQG